MANTTFNGPVRSEAGFKVITKNTDTGAITQSRMSSGMPDLTGLALNDLATGTITLDDNSLNVVNYTGAAAAVATLPAAEAGSVCVYVQAVETAGGTNTLTFDAAGSDVWATGSVFTPANAATNLFTIGSKIAFICYEKGTWHIASEMGGAPTLLKGAFAFAA